jgi:hypothetical protein
MGRSSDEFIMEIAGPKIDLPDLLHFSTQRNLSLQQSITCRLGELKAEYDALVDLYKFNQFVESFKINLQVRINQDYYLYENNNNRFLSIIPPDDLPYYTFHGKTRLNSEGYFIRV